MKKILQQIARVVVGGLFIFSGLIKLNDPKGTAIKLEEYFHVFAGDIGSFFGWFVPLALPLAFLLIVLEVVLGVACILLYRVRLVNNILAGMIVFFTLLTFYSAYFNKVTDCGCFGDAIPLTPWQSFYKDVILLGLIAFLFFTQRERNLFVADLVSGRTAGIAVACTAVLSVSIGLYALFHLPFLDFRNFKIGNHIPTLTEPAAKPKYVYIMEKDGAEYRLDAYPKKEEGYKYKRHEITNEDEIKPKIMDYQLWDEEGDKTKASLLGTKLFIIIQYVSDNPLSEQKIQRLKTIRQVAQETQQLAHLDVWVLTSADKKRYEHWVKPELAPFPQVYADATLLKGMIRSDPGLVLLQDGYVRGKWHYNDIPKAELLRAILW